MIDNINGSITDAPSKSEFIHSHRLANKIDAEGNPVMALLKLKELEQNVAGTKV